MSKFYAYIYYDPSRQMEPIYVGKGKGARSHRHLVRVDKHPFTQRLQFMKRNGVDPVIRIIHCGDEELAFLVEEEGIAKFGRKDLGKGPLLNLSDGGEGNSGYVPTPEALAKQSAGLKGRTFTPEHLAKIQESRIANAKPARRLSEAEKANLRQKMTGRINTWGAKSGTANRGKKRTPEAIANMSKSHIGITFKQHPKTCPHCGKVGGGGSMKRWHFENCKLKR